MYKCILPHLIFQDLWLLLFIFERAQGLFCECIGDLELVEI